MAILTTIALVTLGVTAVAGAANYFMGKDDVEIERLQNRIKEIDEALKGFRLSHDHYSTVKDKIEKAIEYLEEAKCNFKDGGHVQDGVPLAEKQFEDVSVKLHQSVYNTNKILSDIDETIESLEKEKRECNQRIAELKD